ncbi:DUF1360 domain-containing protein [Micromonospora sp. WMMC273]|uniref:DUF1360 domain-containing protein n=1 Tax=Micromonospora sp. WMMC273 TaxID=3015157 RepID=UPI0022B5FC2A|nr:DUF1360 domain-containing protein [Micromonospora sp. WMMC273]MCZ7478912.1 DUF1360 domain-containing protein [Micromonospora sp. WMMC273]
MPPAWVLLVYALAVARLTGLATTDKITQPLRAALVSRVNPHNRLHRGLVYVVGGVNDDADGCPWCASIWIAAAVAPIAWLWGTNPWFAIPALLLAFSQATGMTAHINRG